MRNKNELRNINIKEGYGKYADSSVVVEYGDTIVLVNATIEEKVPFFLKNSGSGWLTAEYSMIPASTEIRKTRDSVKGKIDGRNQEIQRIIGRSLRQAIDLSLIGERTIWIDCDVLQADGGTRTASITGGFVALSKAVEKLYKNGTIKEFPIKKVITAVSVGVIDGEVVLDLDYELDNRADVDLNLVMDENNNIIEIQGTGENAVFSKKELDEMISLGEKGIKKIQTIQNDFLGENLLNLILEIKEVKKQKEEINKEDKKEMSVNTSKYSKTKPKKEILIASSNMHKVHDITKILEKEGISCKNVYDYGIEKYEVEETGRTFLENAYIKAKFYGELSGKITIADDSGLEVDYLNGKPGVYSRRYSAEASSDESNMEKLIEELKEANENERTARFVSSLVLMKPSGESIEAEGYCEGIIGHEKKGENGFGYDPLFVPYENNEEKRTFAQMTNDEKNKISHRGKSLDILIEKIKNSDIFEESEL